MKRYTHKREKSSAILGVRCGIDNGAGSGLTEIGLGIQSRFYCDVCGQAIEKINMGMVKWRESLGLTAYDGVRDLVVCHKVSCDNSTDGRDQWVELSWLRWDRYAWLVGPLQRGERAEIRRPMLEGF